MLSLLYLLSLSFAIQAIHQQGYYNGYYYTNTNTPNHYANNQTVGRNPKIYEICESLTRLEKMFLGTFYWSNNKWEPKESNWEALFTFSISNNKLKALSNVEKLQAAIIEEMEPSRKGSGANGNLADNERAIALKEQLKDAQSIHKKVIDLGLVMQTFPKAYMPTRNSWFSKATLKKHLGKIDFFIKTQGEKSSIDERYWKDIASAIKRFISAVETADETLSSTRITNENSVRYAISHATDSYDKLRETTKSFVRYLNAELAAVRELFPFLEREAFRKNVIRKITEKL